MTELLKIGAEFIQNQGMIAAVVLILAFLMYRQSKIMQGMIDNQAIESKQQGEMLNVLSIQVANGAGIITAVEDMKTTLLEKADAIATDSIEEKRNTRTAIENYASAITGQKQALDTIATSTAKTEKVTKEMWDKLDEIIQQLSGLQNEVQSLKDSPVKLSDEESDKIDNINTNLGTVIEFIMKLSKPQLIVPATRDTKEEQRTVETPKVNQPSKAKEEDKTQ